MIISKLYNNGKYNASLLKENKWLKYLAISSDKNGLIIPPEKNQLLACTLRALEILDKKELNNKVQLFISQTLKWSSVAKGGTLAERNEWKAKQYPIDISNLSSAEIYMETPDDDPVTARIVYTLIKTSGLIEQTILGEVPLNKNYPLNILVFEGLIDINSLRNTLRALNECIISAKSEQIWSDYKDTVYSLIEAILNNNYTIETPTVRLKRIKENFEIPQEVSPIDNVFSFCEMWFIGPVLKEFDNDDICRLLNEISATPEITKVRYITFQPVKDWIIVDDKLNIYAIRLIEKYLKHTENMDVLIKPNYYIKNMVLHIDFILSTVCKNLLNFCIEAEKAELLSYEEALHLLFNIFSLNNTADVLPATTGTNKNIVQKDKKEDIITVNANAKELLSIHTIEKEQQEPDFMQGKNIDILKFIKGTAIMNVGSCSALLNLLVKHFPEADIEGSLFSVNKFERLTEKKKEEKHNWNISDFNLIENKAKHLKDTIIFSSILHEIFSYSTLDGRKFNIDAVKKTLKNAYDSLSSGGRIIIMDGILINSTDEIILKFNIRKDGLSTRTIFNNFLKDFRGLSDIERTITKIDDFTYSLNVNLAREFLHTFSMGIKKYPDEVKKQIAYFTLSDYTKFLQSIGFKIIKADAFPEQLMEDTLSKVSIHNQNKEEVSFPAHSCFIVAEKAPELNIIDKL